MNILRLLNNKLSKHLLVSLVIQAIYTVVTPFSMILLARFLGPKEFGGFAFATSFVIIASIFASLGMPTVVTRYGAIYFIRNNWDKLKGILVYSNKKITIVSISIIIITVIIIVTNVIEIPSKNYILFALPIILFLSLSTIRTALLTAIEKVNHSQLPEMIIRPILFFVIIVILYYLRQLNGYSAIISYTITNAIIFFVGVYMVKKYTKKHFVGINSSYEILPWKKSAIPLFLLGSIQILGAQADVFLLGFLADTKDVGVFKSMYQISLLVIFSLTAVNAVASPYIVKGFEEQNLKSIKELLFIFCGINLVFALVISLPFLLFGTFFIDLLYGEEFVTGVRCMQILILGRIINSIFGISNQFLKMMGEERKATTGILLGTVVGVALNIWLIPKYGIVGAAIASSLGLITWNLYLFRILVIKIWYNNQWA